jgi:hypothetical protein
MKIRLKNNLLIIFLLISFGQAYAQKSDSVKLKISQVELGEIQSFLDKSPNNFFMGVSGELMPYKFKKEKFLRIGYYRHKSFDYFSRYKRFQYPYRSSEIINMITLGATVNVLNRTSFFAIRLGGDLFYHKLESSRGTLGVDSFLDSQKSIGLNFLCAVELFSKSMFSFGLEYSYGASLSNRNVHFYFNNLFVENISKGTFNLGFFRVPSIFLKYNFK